MLEKVANLGEVAMQDGIVALLGGGLQLHGVRFDVQCGVGQAKQGWGALENGGQCALAKPTQHVQNNGHLRVPIDECENALSITGGPARKDTVARELGTGVDRPFGVGLAGAAGGAAADGATELWKARHHFEASGVGVPWRQVGMDEDGRTTDLGCRRESARAVDGQDEIGLEFLIQRVPAFLGRAGAGRIRSAWGNGYGGWELAKLLARGDQVGRDQHHTMTLGGRPGEPRFYGGGVDGARRALVGEQNCGHTVG